jgi:hypothetical protein
MAGGGDHGAWSHGMGLGAGGAAHANGMHGDRDHHFRHFNHDSIAENALNIIPPNFALCPDYAANNIGQTLDCVRVAKARVR